MAMTQDEMEAEKITASKYLEKKNKFWLSVRRCEHASVEFTSLHIMLSDGSAGLPRQIGSVTRESTGRWRASRIKHGLPTSVYHSQSMTDAIDHAIDVVR